MSAVRISPSDVGARVTVRTRLADPAPGEPTRTDTVGILRAWRDGVLQVERRDGTVVCLAAVDVVAARVVPDPPKRSRRAP